jgi:hypothetical protein
VDAGKKPKNKKKGRKSELSSEKNGFLEYLNRGKQPNK